MRFLKFLFFLIIFGALVGGGLYAASMAGIDWSQVFMAANNQAYVGGHGGHQDATGQHGAITQGSAFNAMAVQNRDKLTLALSTLNQAMELVTTDPYSQITMPNRLSEYPRDTTSPSGPVSVAPRDGVTINIGPGVAQVPAKLPDLPTTQNVVFDQNKLELLHNGIFKLSQAMMVLNELSTDFTDQSLMNESNLAPQQVYAARAALTLQNRNKISHANRLLQDAYILVNVNPYAPQSGYIYNTQKMQQLHQGISELAKTSVMLNRILDDLNQQLVLTTNEARLAAAGAGQMQAHNGGAGGFRLIEVMINIALALVIFGVVLWVLALVRRMVRDTTTP